MPSNSRKPRLTYSLTKLYDGRSCLVLAPSLPPPLSSMQESSCSSSASTSSLSSTLLSTNQPSIQSMSPSAPHRLFQPYPPHFPWSRITASSHRNIYLYKETRAEIIQRDKRIALREAAYNEFYARMADESRANHVGVTTRSAAAAAVSSIRGEHPKRTSRVATRPNDSAYDLLLLDDYDSPPRKRARTTARSSNNGRYATSASANNQATGSNDANSAKVGKSAPADETTPKPSTRLTTRSQARSRRTRRRSPADQTPDYDPEVLEDPAMGGTVDAEETAPAPASGSEPQPTTTQDSAEKRKSELQPVANEAYPLASRQKPHTSEEKISSPELSTPRTTLGRASSTSSTLASSRQSSDDGFRKSDQRFTDGLSIDGDANVESGDTEPAATGNHLNAKSNELLSPLLNPSNVAVIKASQGKENEEAEKQSSQSPPPSQTDGSGAVISRAGRAKSPQKRPHSYDNDVEDELDNHDFGPPEGMSVVIPPEVRRSGRVSKKRKLE